MSFWPNESGRFNVLHLDDGHSLKVMGEDLQTYSNVPQIAEQHSGQLSQVFTYGGTPGSSSRPALFGGNKWKGGAIVKNDSEEGEGTPIFPRSWADIY